MLRIQSDQDVLNHLAELVSKSSYREVGESLGFSGPFIYRVLGGKKDLTEKLAGALGFERIPRGWVQKEK
jgi:hypothetical protein